MAELQGSEGSEVDVTELSAAKTEMETFAPVESVKWKAVSFNQNSRSLSDVSFC